jgi:alpha-methylacyl-CoA racemase
LRIVEIEGLGPAPFCGMLLADLGAEVVSIGRRSRPDPRPWAVSERGKRSIALDLKSAQGVEVVLRLCERSDALIEGFRPGVMERLGLGPQACRARNARLVYGRMTGWGQDGPLASTAGHDINYIALSGALHAIGRAGERPVPPLNLVGDFGGGSLFLALGLLAAVFAAQRSGQGQVVDASMVEGSAALLHMCHALLAQGLWRDQRGVNMLDGAAHFYDTYETADGRYVAIGAIEPQFYRLLVELTGVDVQEFGAQLDPRQWPALKQKLAAVFRTRTRDEWCRSMEGTDACFAPVLSLREAPGHPHNAARGSFIEVDGVVQAAPAPRFAGTPAATPRAPHPVGADTEAVLGELGYAAEEVAALRTAGVLT